MKTLKHLCYTSHSEVMFRDEEDMNYAFNSLCSAMCKTESLCLSEAFITTHHHGIYITSAPRELIRTHRIAYTMYFNWKYRRSGPLGEKGYFEQEIDGLRHQIAAISYVLKNPVHHGIAPTPFAYPYCSANAFFRKELGKDTEVRLLARDEIKQALPRRAAFDPSWKMGLEGVFLRESVIECAMVESLYSSPQAFNYMLARKSGEDWIREQSSDDVSASPVTLESIESGFLTNERSRKESVYDMLRNEKSRFAGAVMTDLKLCGIIDKSLISRPDPRTVYELDLKEKMRMANNLYGRFHCNPDQIHRCLVF